MLNLANLAEEVQIAYCRWIKKLKKGDSVDENSATTESDIEETFKRLVGELNKSPQEIFDALKSQTVDLVFTAHPTQSVRRSLLQKHARWMNKLQTLTLREEDQERIQQMFGYEQETKLAVTANVHGMGSEEVLVEIGDGRVFLTFGQGYECYTGNFAMPENVNLYEIHCSIHNRVLYVVVPKPRLPSIGLPFDFRHNDI
ncbi:hypothetical protein Q3G72_034850 [Acer saccharum]|nr:hypothetical protein Q3G72_034850 [Acer saccharum]